MANERMYLCYRPTGDAVFLGKRMAVGWYSPPDDLPQRLGKLYDKAEEAYFKGSAQDDFAVVFEGDPLLARYEKENAAKNAADIEKWKRDWNKPLPRIKRFVSALLRPRQ